MYLNKINMDILIIDFVQDYRRGQALDMKTGNTSCISKYSNDVDFKEQLLINFGSFAKQQIKDNYHEYLRKDVIARKKKEIHENLMDVAN